MSNYLYNAAYYWEVVVDSRNPQLGYPVYLEERSHGRRRYLKTLPNSREMETFCRAVQKDLYLTEEEFEAKYEVTLTHTEPDAPAPNGLPQMA